MAVSYKDAGVDIAAGARFVEAIRPLAARASRPEVLGEVGGFAGLFRLPAGYRDPVLVSGTDGVGTKLKTAIATGRHDTVGIDLVAMAVNDVVVCGAEALFFLDYLAVGRLDPEVGRQVVGGIVEGCQQAGCALVGGETAELPGLYRAADYDLAGFCVGVVERDDIRHGRDIDVGDMVIGLPSSGLHSNGHSLARKVLLDRFELDDQPAALAGASVADELLRPTIIYVPAFAALARASVRFKGAAHITGGGLIDNAPRMLPREDLAFALDPSTWTVPAIFSLIADSGVEQTEMYRTFNMGIGMIAVVSPADADRAVAALTGFQARIIGRIEPVAALDQVGMQPGVWPASPQVRIGLG
ncbi:MAG: phosphoribosylformylglycinamidine cyclo-ligase [Proteobacteria bacterium]|nr:phosphoribosylformylglycinamidine cyclo-ligase [Pseudomonadota bacterium]